MLKNIQNNDKKITQAKQKVLGNHSQLVGTPVKISPKYKKWIKENINKIFITNEEDLSYQSAKKIANGTIKYGIIKKTKYDNEDFITLTVELDNGHEWLFGITDVQEIKV